MDETTQGPNGGTTTPPTTPATQRHGLPGARQAAAAQKDKGDDKPEKKARKRSPGKGVSLRITAFDPKEIASAVERSGLTKRGVLDLLAEAVSNQINNSGASVQSIVLAALKDRLGKPNGN